MPSKTDTDILLFDIVKWINLDLQYFEQSFMGTCMLMIWATACKDSQKSTVGKVTLVQC